MTTEDIVNEPFSSYKFLSSSRHICLPPRYLGSVAQGIRDQLDSEINLYCSDLESVVISYDNLKLLQEVGSILDDSQFLHFRVQADYIVFNPTIGCILKGIVNKVSKDHVGCLVHNRFNASIHRPRHNLNGWRGSHLQQGEEFPFEVIDVYSNNAVISLKGKLVDQKIIEAYLRSLKPEGGSKKGSRDENGSGSVVEVDGGEITLDNEPVLGKKRSRKSSISERIDESLDMVDGNIQLSSSKKKKKKKDMEVHFEESLVVFQKSSKKKELLPESVCTSSTPVSGKKRRHSVETNSVNEFEIMPDAGLSAIKKVRVDSSFKKKEKKRQKLLLEDESGISEFDDSSFVDSSVLDDSLLPETIKKKKKKKKHKKDVINSDVEQEMTKLKNKRDSSSFISEKKKKKEVKKAIPSDSNDDSDDQVNVIRGLKEGFGTILTGMHSGVTPGKNKKKKSQENELIDGLLALQSEVTKAATKLMTPSPSSSKKKKQKKKKRRESGSSPERELFAETPKNRSKRKSVGFIDDLDNMSVSQSRLQLSPGSEDGGGNLGGNKDDSISDSSQKKKKRRSVNDCEFSEEVTSSHKKKKLKKEKE